MSKKQETVADIVAEKRRRAAEIERDVVAKIKSGIMISDQYAREVIADLREEASRLEAAMKREQGNVANLREAAKYVQCTMDRLRDPADKNYLEMIHIWVIVTAALAAPRKNCDRFQTWDEAKDAYWREQGDPCDWRKLGAWLFAPEGGAK